MQLRRYRTSALVALGFVAVAAAAAAYHWLRPLPVTVAMPAENAALAVDGLGAVEARVLSEIGFQVGGTLIDLAVDHGDRVSAGGIVARLESGAQEARLAKAAAGVALARAALEQANARLGRANAILHEKLRINTRRQELVTRGTVSVEAAEEAQTAAEVAAADVTVAQSEVDLAAAALEDARANAHLEDALTRYYTLTAPYEGVVVKRHAELGAALSAGQTLFTFVDPTTIWVRAYVDEARAGGLQVGQRAEIRLRSLPQQVFAGSVARIDIESDRVSEERRVHVTCDSCPRQFHLGEQAEVVIRKSSIARAILVPESAVQEFDGRTGRVWTVEDGQLGESSVTFGERTLAGRNAIAAALPPDVAVLTELRPGLRVGRAARVTSTASETAAAAAGAAS